MAALHYSIKYAVAGAHNLGTWQSLTVHTQPDTVMIGGGLTVSMLGSITRHCHWKHFVSGAIVVSDSVRLCDASLQIEDQLQETLSTRLR